jgi:hypothetical protein
MAPKYFNHHHEYFHEDHPFILDEMQYNDLLHSIDPRDLPHRDYAPLVKYVKYVETNDNIMKFYVPSPTPEKYRNMDGLNLWETYIQFLEWPQQVADMSLNVNEAARLTLWGANLRIYCPCPAYLYWGMAYIDTQLGIAMVPEERFPSIRNPELKGIACKHLRRTIKTLPFHLGDMAKAMREQRAGATNTVYQGPSQVPNN